MQTIRAFENAIYQRGMSRLAVRSVPLRINDAYNM
jgi:hypothetical protein